MRVLSVLLAAFTCCLAVRVSYGQLQAPVGYASLYDGFSQPYDVATDSSGSIYVADVRNTRTHPLASTCTALHCSRTLMCSLTFLLLLPVALCVCSMARKPS